MKINKIWKMPLTIGGVKISSISGPVSFQLLEPNIDIFNEFKKYDMHLPIVMLFGDIHSSYKKQCKKCNCSKGCFSIYSKEFLSLLDSLANDDHPIDFNTESYFVNSYKDLLKNPSLQLQPHFADEYEESFNKYNKLQSSTKGIPLDLLTDSIVPCYLLESKKINLLNSETLYEKFCPTKNIRWQHVDTRFSNKFNFEYKLNKIGELISFFFDNIDNITLNTFKKKIKETCNYFDNNSFEMIEYLSIVEKMMLFNAPSYLEKVFDNPTKYNSLVYKQISKIIKQINLKGGNIKYSNLSFWKSICDVYHQKILQDTINEDMIWFKENGIEYEYSKNVKNTQLIFKLIKDIIYNNAFENSFEKLKLIRSYIYNWDGLITGILDLYYVFRAFKKPKNANNAFLSIGYFGNYHSKNIAVLLSDIMNFYKIVAQDDSQNPTSKTPTSKNPSSKNPSSKNLRCLTFENTNVDINQIASKYNVFLPKIKLLKNSHSLKKSSCRKNSPRKTRSRKTRSRKSRSSPRKKTSKSTNSNKK